MACGLIVQSTVFLPVTQENIDQKQNSKKAKDSSLSHPESPVESNKKNKEYVGNKRTTNQKSPSKLAEGNEKNISVQITQKLPKDNSNEESDKNLSQSDSLMDSNETENEIIENQWVSIRKTPLTVTDEKENTDERSSDESLELLLSSDNSSSCEPNLTRKCEICHWKLLMSSKPSKQNLIEYQKHLLMHTNKAMFGELPFLDKYYCPKSLNQKQELKMLSFSNLDTDKQTQCSSSFNDRESFVLHLSNHHDEFYTRLTRRLRETGESGGESSGSSEEYNQLKAIKRSLQNKITQKLFEFEIPKNSSFVQQICNETDLLDMYEKEHTLRNPEQFLHCIICEKVFKNAENSLLHLFLEHFEIFHEKLRLISEQEDEVAFNNAIKMLGWKNDGNPTRMSYCCPFGSCAFGKFHRF